MDRSGSNDGRYARSRPASGCTLLDRSLRDQGCTRRHRHMCSCLHRLSEMICQRLINNLQKTGNYRPRE